MYRQAIIGFKPNRDPNSMSVPKIPAPAKLVISLLMGDRKHFEAVAQMLADKFGAPDFISSWMAFDYTDYYTPEMGAPLSRRMMAFKTLVRQEDLPEIKLITNAVEDRFAKGGSRTVNIDPGYLLQERFVLATGKNFAHRIYAGRGIYADLTLIYQKNAFRALPWTYPDYAADDMQTVLGAIRDAYRLDLVRKQ